MEPHDLRIIAEDAHLLVVNKPGGLLTQPRGPSVGEPSLEDAVRAHLSPGDPKGVYLGTVHRLDRPVSGVIVWAKNPKAARRLAEQFERRSVEKTYVAAVEGIVADETTTSEWVDWLAPVGPSGAAEFLDAEVPGARLGSTVAVRIDGGRRPAGTSVLKLLPKTGRTHQLRIQTAKRGHPILGDSAYGSARPFPAGIALHARTLVVHHPARDVRTTYVAPFPESWTEAGFADVDRPLPN